MSTMSDAATAFADIDYGDVERPMTKADRKAWVDALRSGDYQQGCGCLVNKDYCGVLSYCCLGVAAEVLGIASATDEYLQVRHRASVVDLTSAFLPRITQFELADLNDEDGKDFAFIADVIETIPAVDEEGTP